MKKYDASDGGSNSENTWRMIKSDIKEYDKLASYRIDKGGK